VHAGGEEETIEAEEKKTPERLNGVWEQLENSFMNACQEYTNRKELPRQKMRMASRCVYTTAEGGRNSFATKKEAKPFPKK